MYFIRIKKKLDMKIKYLTIICAIAFSFMACENQENDFDDFGSTSVYFPFQTPIRTIIQGEYDLGYNENDNNGIFEIGVVMSGVYENDINRKVYFELAPDLIDAAALGLDTVNVKVLPSSYYTIQQESPVTIPSGSTKGRIPVQLSDAFFDDPQSFGDFGEVHYVVPLRITDYEELDSLLVGVPAEGVTNPIKINADDWETQPKDYTLFGIKFMNKYEGMYLRRGEDKIVGTSTILANGVTETVNIDDSTIYRDEFVVGDEVTLVKTSGRNKAISTNQVRRAGIPSNSNVSIELTFDDNGEIVITSAEDETEFVVTGTGTFVVDGDEWGGESRDVIYLEYEYRDLEVVQEFVFGQLVSESTLDLMHTVKDTLVIRDRNVAFEEFEIQLTVD